VFARSFYVLLQRIPAAYKKLKLLPVISLLVLCLRFLMYLIVLNMGGFGIAFATMISEIIGIVVLHASYRKIYRFELLPFIKTLTIAALIGLLSLYKVGVLVIDLLIAALLLGLYYLMGGVLRVLRKEDVYYMLKIRIPVLYSLVKIIAKLGRYNV